VGLVPGPPGGIGCDAASSRPALPSSGSFVPSRWLCTGLLIPFCGRSCPLTGHSAAALRQLYNFFTQVQARSATFPAGRRSGPARVRPAWANPACGGIPARHGPAWGRCIRRVRPPRGHDRITPAVPLDPGGGPGVPASPTP